MTFRSTVKETTKFFTDAKVDYSDETYIFGEHKLHYIQTGDANKPTLFFVHGSPGSWNAYKNYLKDSLLLKKYRMIAIDRPGFGYSDFGQAEDLKTQTNYITNFLKTINNNQPIILIGHSLGGPIIVKMATENPEWYKHLVILAGSVDPKAETKELWRPVIKTVPLRYLIPGAMRPANDELWWLKKDLYDMQPDLGKITSDVTVVHGTNDNLVPYSNVAFIRRELSNAKSMTIISIENANHFIPWEHFETIRNALLELNN